LTVLEVYNPILRRQEPEEAMDENDDGRVKCLECSNRSLRNTAKLNGGLCAPCAQENKFLESIPEIGEGRMAMLIAEAEERGVVYAIETHRRIYGSTLREAKSAIEAAMLAHNLETTTTQIQQTSC
jgi:hypothetical protein